MSSYIVQYEYQLNVSKAFIYATSSRLFVLQPATHFGAIQVLRNAVGVGCYISQEKALRAVLFNIISVTRGWVGVEFPGKKRYVTLEWPLI